MSSLQICAAVPNRHLFPFVRLAADLVDKYRYKYTHKLNKSLGNYKYKYQTLTSYPSFICNLRIIGKISFCVFVFVFAYSQSSQNSLVLLFSSIAELNGKLEYPSVQLSESWQFEVKRSK